MAKDTDSKRKAIREAIASKFAGASSRWTTDVGAEWHTLQISHGGKLCWANFNKDFMETPYANGRTLAEKLEQRKVADALQEAGPGASIFVTKDAIRVEAGKS